MVTASSSADAVTGRVTVVAVTHNSGAVIGQMLETLPEGLPVLVVDNCSTDGTTEIVAAHRPSARLIRSAENGGYGCGMNQAFDVVSTPFALVVGPDASLTSDAVERLVARADSHPEAALIGPRLLNPDGSIEPSHDVALDVRSRYGRRDFEPPAEGPVCANFLSGAVWLARMTCIREVGGFDPAIFLYYEDDDLCRRLRAAGYSLILEPAAEVTHIGGGSVPGTITYSRLKYWHMAWSRLHYERKHRGRPAMWGVFLREAPAFLLKAAGYVIVGNRGKSRRDFARCCGMFAAIAGWPSH